MHERQNMKPINFNKFLVLAFALAIAATGCKKTPVGVTDLHGRGYREGSRVENPSPGEALTNNPNTFESANSTNLPVRPTEGFAQNTPRSGWPQNREILKADAVYFDYDSSVVKTGERPKVAAVADYLKANPAHAVKIEGNCDERGTEGYNLALGERRALALREHLAQVGVDPSRVETASFGKDKPVATGHDEAAWKLNRRGDFVVLTPPTAPAP